MRIAVVGLITATLLITAGGTYAANAPTVAAGEVVVVIRGVVLGKGVVRVSLCNEANWMRSTCPYQGSTPANAPEVKITLHKVVPGAWAAQAYQDANSNGHADFGPFGIPQESMGASRGAAGHFGPPAFKDAVLTLPASPGPVVVTLHH